MAEPRMADVLIVGAGPAGCVLANRLSEDSGSEIVLLEAGPDYGPDPTAWPTDLVDATVIGADLHSWNYLHADRPADFPLWLPRTRVVGGSSTINACVWLRGSATDYDAWEAAGNPGWAFADLLPAFLRAESDPLGGPLHGSTGPIPVARVDTADLEPVDNAFVETAAGLGFPVGEDLNEAARQRPCVGPTPKNIAGGVRMNAAFTYLAAARSRPNLTIIPDSEIDRVVLNGDRATGVRTVGGQVYEAQEVILAAGAYGSPVILMRSGIGPAGALRELETPVVADLTGVGRNLLDHPLLEAGRTGAVWPIRPEVEVDAGSVIPVMVKARSNQAGDEIDLHLYMGHTRVPERGNREFWISVSMMDGRSQGRVSLTSRDPGTPPRIDHAYFSEPRDLEAMCDGFDLALEMAGSQPLAAMIEPAPVDRLRGRDRDELRRWAREHVSTTFHPSGTCRMGLASDPGAVVDHRGRVHGVTGLRVVDASIFPTGPRANLHWSVVAVAEKLASDT